MTGESAETVLESETMDQYDTELDANDFTDMTIETIHQDNQCTPKIRTTNDEYDLKGLHQMECKKTIENIALLNDNLFFSYKNCVYKNAIQIIKINNKSKIVHLQLHEEDILIADEKSFLKYFSVLKGKYLVVRDYKLKGVIRNIGISPSGKEFVAVNETHLFLMKSYSPDVKEIKHNLRINEEISVNYLENGVLIKTEKELNLFDFAGNCFEKIFRLEKVLGSRILSCSVSKNGFALLTDKYILLNERVIGFSGGKDCKLFNNQLFISTKNSLIVFSLNLRQLFKYKHLCDGFKFQTNFEIKRMEIEKLKKILNFYQTINIERIAEIENQLTNLCIQQKGSIIKGIKKYKTDGLLIFTGSKIFFPFKKQKVEEKKKSNSLFYNEKSEEKFFFETLNKKLSNQDFLIKRNRYSQALMCLLKTGTRNSVLKCLKKYQKAGVFKFVFKEKEMRNQIIDFFLMKKAYLSESRLFVNILEHLFVEYEIDYKREALKETVERLYEINVDSCLIYGYLESKL